MRRKSNAGAPIIDLAVADDVHQILPPCPAVGEGVHKAILGAVSELALLGYGPEEIPGMVEEWMSPVTTPFPREIPDAMAKVFGDGDPRLRGEVFEKVSTWPAADISRILEIARAGDRTELGHLLELIESSPYDVNVPFGTEDWLDIYYQDNDLLCIGENKFSTEVKSRASWRGNVRYAQFISPNPFRAEIWGRKKDNVPVRKYLVTEIDIQSGIGALGLMTQSYQLNSFDVQGAIINHLKQLDVLKLLSIIYSGKKSLHAYWQADSDEKTNGKFMEIAVSLGVDKAGWTLSQFARILNPGAPEYQELLYLDTL